MLHKSTPPLTDESESETNRSTGRVASTPRREAADATEDTAATDSSTHTTPQERTIELDQMFGLLKNRRRRDVLRHLAEDNSQVQLGELAEVIAARECGKAVSQINSQERKRVYVGLYQCHLPKLAETDVIAYNKPRGIIERGPSFDQITEYLPARENPTKEAATARPLLATLSNMVSTGRSFL